MKTLFAVVISVMVANEAGAASQLNVSCVAAAGYYGGISIQSTGELGPVQIRVKSGTSLNPTKFLKDLELIGAGEFVGSMVAQLPAGASRASQSDSFEGSCSAWSVKAVVHTESGAKTVVIPVLGIRLRRIEPESGKSALNVLIAGSRRLVSVRPLFARTSQNFAIQGPADSSCRAQ